MHRVMFEQKKKFLEDGICRSRVLIIKCAPIDLSLQKIPTRGLCNPNSVVSELVHSENRKSDSAKVLNIYEIAAGKWWYIIKKHETNARVLKGKQHRQ